jgi:hypothetical protein
MPLNKIDKIISFFPNNNQKKNRRNRLLKVYETEKNMKWVNIKKGWFNFQGFRNMFNQKPCFVHKISVLLCTKILLFIKISFENSKFEKVSFFIKNSYHK